MSEGLEDLAPLSTTKVHQAVVSANDWTTETIINQINKGNIQLNPKFQRRDAWDFFRKSRFIESLFLGLPIPQLVLAESRDRKGKYIVIDGKQRLLSIRQFAAQREDPLFNPLKLVGLAIRKELTRKTLEDLRDDPTLANDLAAFENQPIRTVVIKNWPNEDFLYHVFLRLNTGSVPLSPQELRQALHPGPFLDFADSHSGESEALREILNIKKPDFRMRDVELLIRVVAFSFFLHEYTGDLKSFLDHTCKFLNANWTDWEARVKRRLKEFAAAHQLVRQIFAPKNMYRKWTGHTYERPFNRAIFDTMLYAFATPSVRARVKPEDYKRINTLFQQLCSENVAFLSSIEKTTKSLDATCTRLSVWAEALNQLLSVSIPLPRIAGNRIAI